MHFFSTDEMFRWNTSKLTDSIILKSSIVMLDQSLENRLRFYVNDYSDLGEIFERDSEQTLELEKYWTISI